MTFPVILASLILCLGGLYTAQYRDFQIKADLNRSHIELMGAIDKTKSTLAQTAFRIQSDKSLFYNLSNGKTRTAKRILTSYQRDGLVTNIVLYDQSCRKLLTLPKKGGTPSCRQDLSTGVETIARWSKILQKPTITHISKFEQRQKTYWIHLTTFLDNQWYEIEPALNSLVNELSLKITKGDSQEYTKLRQLPSFGRQVFLSQKIDGMGFLITNPASYSNLIRQLITICLFSSMVLCLLILWQTWQYTNNKKHNLSHLLQWGKTLIPKPNSDQIVLPNQLLRGPKVWPEIEIFQKGLIQILEGYSKTMKQKAELNYTTSKSLRESRREIDQLSLEITQIPLYQSLAHQVKSESRLLRSDALYLDQNSKDSEAIVMKGCIPAVQSLQRIFTDWQSQCRQVTPRKFIRTLSEQKAPDGSYPDRLQWEVNEIFQTCSQILNHAVQLSIHNRKARKKIERISDRMQLWNLLSKQEADVEPSHDIAAPLKSSLNILESAEAAHKGLIEATQNIGARVSHLGIPSFMWQAIFYHILRCFESHSGQLKKDLYIEILEKNGRTNLVFSLRDALVEKKELSPFSRKHLELSSAIARSLPLQVRKLPDLKEALLICVSWESEDEEITASSENESASETPAGSLCSENSLP